MMETIEAFSDFLRKIGVPNILAIGIVLMVLWLLVSGLLKGLRKKGGDSESDMDHEDEVKGS
jgi:hypothetical protein